MENVESAMHPIPGVGEHTETILRELGVEPTTIASWRQDGVV
jgi:itaconate CoA-transferase